jgi:regulator of RNase E activity RraA
MEKMEIVSGRVTTAHLADACLRLGVRPRCAPLYPAGPTCRLAGPVIPVQHFGSVDVFLEVIDSAAPGSVLVVDNGGRRDESCVGDLVTLEAARAGLAGIIIWGYHRDTAEIRAIGLPVFSLGAFAVGPTRLDARSSDAFSVATIGDFSVSRADIAVADDDGVLFIPEVDFREVARQGKRIGDIERLQAERANAGVTLRAQLQFAEYLKRRSVDGEITFRQYLREISGAIEE